MSLDLEALAIRYQNNRIYVLDQELLPTHESWIETSSIAEMASHIKALKIRGAPLIGIAALLSLAQFAQQGANKNEIINAAKILVQTRPTAVNLVNYINYLLEKLKIHDVDIVAQIAQQLFIEDQRLCNQIAKNGAELFKSRENVMTYCNTGGLATAGSGTALGIIKQAYREGKINNVFVCETRPLLQGARLTTWELDKEKIPFTLICDNTAAVLMQKKQIQGVFVGADRIAINGDFANKIGTYTMALLASFHQIPFYVAAPYTTIDPHCQNGEEIEIEQRNPNEVLGFKNKDYSIKWCPENTQVYNPSFDVTPGGLVTQFIFDKGRVAPGEIQTIL